MTIDQTEFPGAAPLKDEHTTPSNGAVTSPAHPSAPGMPALLLPGEADLMAELERDIESNLEAAVRVAIALSTIRERRLYRDKFETFDAYCQARWDMPARSVHRFIREGEVLRNLGLAVAPGPHQNSPKSALPAGSSIIRPLIGLPAAQQRKAWAAACAQAPNGKPTRALVEKIGAEYKARAPQSNALRENPDAATTEMCGMLFLARGKKDADREGAVPLHAGARVLPDEDMLKHELQTRIEKEAGIGAAERNERLMRQIAELFAQLDLSHTSCPAAFARITREMDRAVRQSADYAERLKHRGAVRDPGKPLGQGNFKVRNAEFGVRNVETAQS
jgi:hypothetical protein